MKKPVFFTIIFLIILSTASVFPKSAIDYYNQGKTDYFNENYDAAINDFRNALDINPNYVDVLLELSHLYYDIENYGYAYKYITRALELSPANEELSVFCADIQTKLGMYGPAEKKYSDVLKTNPLNIRAQNGLANLYMITNKKTLAKSTLDGILKADPDNFEALLLTARYYESFDKNTAEKYYTDNIEKNSLNPDAFFYYSVFDYKNNRASDAVDNIRTAISIKPESVYKKYLGKYLLFLDRGDEALENFRDILKNEKNNYIIFSYVASCYYLISE